MKISNSVEVCNLALLKINQSSISSLTDDSLQAKACKMTYEQSKACLLAQYNWTFAINRAVLVVAQDNSRLPNETDADYNARRDPTLFEYMRKCSLPEKFLRLIAVYNSFNDVVHVSSSMIKPPYVLEGGGLLADQAECKIKYIKDTDIVSEFSAQFIDCFVLDLAIRLTKFFNDSTSYLQQLQADYMLQIEKAKVSDCQQTMLYSQRSYPLLAESWSF